MIIKPITLLSFRRTVDDFCEKYEVSRREFGVQALNDTAFYTRLRKEIYPTLDRVERVYDFMIEFERKLDVTAYSSKAEAAKKRDQASTKAKPKPKSKQRRPRA